MTRLRRAAIVAGLIVVSVVAFSPPVAAAPGTVSAGIYYPTTTGEQLVNGTNGSTVNFAVLIAADADNGGLRAFHVTISMRIEIVDVGNNFEPASGWTVTDYPKSVALDVPPRSHVVSYFNMTATVEIHGNTTVDPDVHTYYTASGDAPVVTPSQETETSLNLKLQVNASAPGAPGGSGGGGGGLNLGDPAAVGGVVAAATIVAALATLTVYLAIAPRSRARSVLRTTGSRLKSLRIRKRPSG